MTPRTAAVIRAEIEKCYNDIDGASNRMDDSARRSSPDPAIQARNDESVEENYSEMQLLNRRLAALKAELKALTAQS